MNLILPPAMQKHAYFIVQRRALHIPMKIISWFFLRIFPQYYICLFLIEYLKLRLFNFVTNIFPGAFRIPKIMSALRDDGISLPFATAAMPASLI